MTEDVFLGFACPVGLLLSKPSPSPAGNGGNLSFEWFGTISFSVLHQFLQASA